MSYQYQLFGPSPDNNKGYFRFGDVEIYGMTIENENFKVYDGVSDEYGPVILKISNTSEENNVLESEVEKFEKLKATSKMINRREVESGISKCDCSTYWALFTHVLRSFIDEEYGDYRVNMHMVQGNILSILMTISEIKSGWQIDAQSSSWMLHDILELYEFMEKNDISLFGSYGVYPAFNPDNYLLSVVNHRTICYDVSTPKEDAMPAEHIKDFAEFFLDWAAFESEEDLAYRGLLNDFASGGYASFAESRQELCQLVDRLWGDEYHYFTFRKYGASEWKEEGGGWHKGNGRVNMF